MSRYTSLNAHYPNVFYEVFGARSSLLATLSDRWCNVVQLKLFNKGCRQMATWGCTHASAEYRIRLVASCKQTLQIVPNT